MLHELLLALVGYTGDFVIDVRAPREPLDNFASEISDDSPTFRLAADISFIHPSERCVIERLLPLGFYYRELDRFAASCRNLSSVVDKQGVCRKGVALGSLNGGSSSPSTYRRAVANGVVEILSAYRAAVLQLEQRLLGDPEPILATVTQGMSKFLAILPPLHELIVEIERDDVRGGQLLDLLHKRCHCGFFGMGIKCFIINLPLGWFMAFFKISMENSSLRGSIDKTSTDASYGDWNLGFHINLGMLPRHIDMRTAESVLFAGKAITVLRNPSSFRFREALVHQQSYKVSNKFQGISGNFAFQKETRTPSFAGELFPQSESDKIEGMLQELKDLSEFQSRKFTLVVNSIRTIAANHLWQLVVVRADLNGHLKALKDYFLLAKGDFFQCFLDESRQLMKLPPRQSTAEADLMVPFQLAALKTISDEDKYFSRVSIRMPAFGSNEGTGPKDFGMKLGIFQGTDSSEGSLDGWDCISLDYSLNWPLPMFFTQDVLTKYGRIFQYLLQLKRTQMELEKSWAAVMQQNHFEFAGYRKDRKNYFISQMLQQQSRPMWRVREHMAFLIRNLQFYIQVDVIESQWNILQAHVQECSDFTELVAFHQEYLIALISQSFLDIGSISRILNSIMKLCLRFCWNVENQESISNSSELEQIIEEFNKKSNSLYTILRNSRIAGSQRAPSLRRFLMRLNFNSLFEVRGLNISRSRPTPPTAL
ncbi:GAMMA-TUBULIN COMPLEX PROTEIN 4 isoform X2 [Wolffia australiana]